MGAVPSSYYRIDPDRMREGRRRAMLTQTRLAEVAQVNYDTVTRIEQGQRRHVYGQQAAVVRALAEAMDVPIVWLLGGENPQENPQENTMEITGDNGRQTLGQSPGIAPGKDPGQSNGEPRFPSRAREVLAFDLGSDLGTTQPLLPSSKAVALRADPEAAAIRRELREALEARGVRSFPRDWHLKVDAVLGRWLKDGTPPEDVRDALLWGSTHQWFADKLHDPGKLRDLLPQYQQRGASNGRPSPHRLDRIVAAAKEAIRDRG